MVNFHSPTLFGYIGGCSTLLQLNEKEG